MQSPRIFLITGLVACLVALSGFPVASEAGWVWSPQTGWIGSGGAVKDSPADQLEYALSFLEKKDYKKAKAEFRKLLKAYKDSPEAPEAQYRLGFCEEEMGDYYKAFLSYRRAIQVYPSTSRFDEVLEHMYRIGNHFLGGRKRKILGTAAIMPARDKAIEIFEAIVEDGPFSEYGELSQYKLGLAYLALQNYEEAVSAFNQLIERYPQSPLVDDARYQIAISSLKGAFRPGYDQSPSEQARRELEIFLQQYPDSDLSAEAVGRLRMLAEQQAEHDFQVAQFYERGKRKEAARITYESIIERFPQTSWATQAAGRISVLEKK